MKRLTDEELRRAEMDADVAKQYYGRHGKLPTGTGLDVIDRVPAMAAELRELRALLATPMPGQPPTVWRLEGRDVVRWGLSVAEPDEAIALGAALIRAAMQAKGGGNG